MGSMGYMSYMSYKGYNGYIGYKRFLSASLRRWRRVLGCAVIGAFFLVQSGRSTPTAYERRVINYHQVDLMPLFEWWDRRKGVRPLSSWKHVEGMLERETAYGWLIRGTIEGQSGLHYFLLRNPPQKDLARLRELENSLPELEQQRATELAVAKQPMYEGREWNAYGELVRSPTENYDRIEQAQTNLQDLDTRIAEIRQEMAGMLDKRGNFRVDAFALDMNQIYQGSPVFDFGFPSY
jgi:hypothetical protein